jgi:hypothetical protein
MGEVRNSRSIREAYAIYERNNVLLVLHVNVRNDADITAAWSQR